MNWEISVIIAFERLLLYSANTSRHRDKVWIEYCLDEKIVAFTVFSTVQKTINHPLAWFVLPCFKWPGHTWPIGLFLTHSVDMRRPIWYMEVERSLRTSYIKNNPIPATSHPQSLDDAVITAWCWSYHFKAVCFSCLQPDWFSGSQSADNCQTHCHWSCHWMQD